ncbi:major facilitator family transporter [Streptococcus varani]|uniref:Major facilitator family transporter n=1 Tax=Streptococcus varani TaxID=1608583 RepID=A0A0E3WEM2_9STRE|nr:OFA family MFS transporter [Streptococcus varani]CQR23931.1 major facilitator family transporter [Streptococcus varani]
MDEKLNRWVVLAASTAILLCTGAVYAFSTFAMPLSEQMKWSMPEIMLAFSINSAIGPIPMILGGYFADKGWVKWSIAVGALMFAVGFYLTGTATSLTQLYLYYGVIAGLGQGFAYSGCLSNTLRLFPDKRGLASGIITGGMGLAAVFASPIGNSLILSHDVRYAFRTIGMVYIVIVLVASLFIKKAPAGYKPEGWNPPEQAAGKTMANKNWVEMIKTPVFYVIILMFFVGAFSGLMIAANARTIGTSMFGLSATAAALYVSLYSVANSSGRFIWGSVSDKIGRSKTLYIIYTVVALALAVIAFVPGQIGFIVGIVGLGICFGGVMGVFPSIVMENYGPANQGVNYVIVFSGYSIAAYFAPSIAAKIATANNGNFSVAFYVAIVLAILGIGFNFTYRKITAK